MSMSPALASTLPANPRRPDWLEPSMPARLYSLVTWLCRLSQAL